MDQTPASVDSVFAALQAGLPLLLSQVAVAFVLLAVGVVVLVQITPYREYTLVRAGNVAGGISMAGSILALAIPLAALLATSGTVLDIAVWGVVAIILQLVAVGVVALLLRHLGRMITEGNEAAALVLAATQLAVALLNAAVMVPT